MIKVFFQDVGALDEYNFGLPNCLINYHNLSVTIGASTVPTFLRGLRFKSRLKHQGNRFGVKLMNPPLSDLLKVAAGKSLVHLYQMYFSSFDILHLNNPTSPYLGSILRANVPKILTLHHALLPEESKSIEMFSKVLARMNYVTVPSRLMARDVEEKLGREPVVIHHGVNTNMFNSSITKHIARNRLGIPSTKKVVLWSSRLSPEKQLETMIDAIPRVVKEMPTAFFLIEGRAVGQRRYVRYILQYTRKRIKETKIESKVRFVLRRFPHEEMPTHYRSADLFVHTSRLESFGLVLAEAMACKIPVLTADNVCYKELLGETGSFFKQGNSEDLAEKIIRLLADEDLRKTLGAEGQQRVLENFTWEKAAQQYLNLYQSCMQGS